MLVLIMKYILIMSTSTCLETISVTFEFDASTAVLYGYDDLIRKWDDSLFHLNKKCMHG